MPSNPYYRSGPIACYACRASLCGKLQNLDRAIRRYAAWFDSGLPRKRSDEPQAKARCPAPPLLRFSRCWPVIAVMISG